MEPNTKDPHIETPALPPEGDAPFFTPEEFAEMQQRARKSHSASLTSQLTSQFTTLTMEFVVRLQRAQNEAALPSQSGAVSMRAAYNAIGQLLYIMGTQTQYTCIRLARGARDLCKLTVRGSAALVRFVCGPLWALLCSIGEDLSAPIRYIAVSVRNMRETVHAEGMAGGNARKAGWEVLKGNLHTYQRLILSALSYLLPVGAFAIFFFTVHEVLGSNFSLGVTYQDDLFAFIESEGVWDEAERMVRERVQASAGAQLEWESHPEFELRLVDPAARTGVSELADKIISSSTDQIMRAVGIRINGELVSVVQDGQAVQQLLDETLAAYNDGTHESVGYVHTIEQVPGVYFTNSVQDTTMALEALQIGNALDVQVTDLIQYEENVPYTTEEQETDTLYKGVRFVTQEGRDGSQSVVARQTRVNGELLSTTPLRTTPIKEMQPEIISVGTRVSAGLRNQVQTAQGGAVVGSGAMVFPVPDMKQITTWYGVGGHRGIDLAAPYGSPILALDSGVVIETGWHYSWGNYVLIDHGNGFYSRYGHCSQLLVTAGTNVTAGQTIALVGSTGYSTGNHLHLELSYGGLARSNLLDPAPFIGLR